MIKRKINTTYIHTTLFLILPEAGSLGSWWKYTGLRRSAKVELPASGRVLRIMLYLATLDNT